MLSQLRQQVVKHSYPGANLVFATAIDVKFQANIRFFAFSFNSSRPWLHHSTSFSPVV